MESKALLAQLQQTTDELDAAVRDHAKKLSAMQCMEAAQAMLRHPRESLLYAMLNSNRTDNLVSLAAATMAREACRKAEALLMAKEFE